MPGLLLLFLAITAHAEGIQCGAKRFEFRAGYNGWYFNDSASTPDANFLLKERVRTEDGSYEKKFTYGDLTFDLRKGTGNFVVTFDNGDCRRGGSGCRTISTDACAYTSKQETESPDFFTLDFCFGRTDRIDQAILDGVTIDLSKRYLGQSPFQCALHASADLMPYLAKRKKFLAFDPNERSAEGLHPLFSLPSRDRILSYLKAFPDQIDFAATYGAGNNVLHFTTDREVLATYLALEQSAALLRAVNKAGQTPVQVAFARYTSALGRSQLELLQLLADRAESDLTGIQGNLIDSLLRLEKLEQLQEQATVVFSSPRLRQLATWSKDRQEKWAQKVLHATDAELGRYFRANLPAEAFPILPPDRCAALVGADQEIAENIIKREIGGGACVALARESLEARLVNREGYFAYPDRYDLSLDGKHVLITTWDDTEKGSSYKFQDLDVETGVLRYTYGQTAKSKNDQEQFLERFAGGYDYGGVYWTDSGLKLVDQPSRQPGKAVMELGEDLKPRSLSTIDRSRCQATSLHFAPGLCQTAVEILKPDCFRIGVLDLITGATGTVEGLSNAKSSREELVIERAGGIFGGFMATLNGKTLRPGAGCAMGEERWLPFNARRPLNGWELRVPGLAQVLASAAVPYPDWNQLVLVTEDGASITYLEQTQPRARGQQKLFGYDGEYFYSVTDERDPAKRALAQLELVGLQPAPEPDRYKFQFRLRGKCRVPAMLPVQGMGGKTPRYELFQFTKLKTGALAFHALTSAYGERFDKDVYQTVCRPVPGESLEFYGARLK